MRKLPAARGLAWFTGSLILLRAQFVRLLLIGLVLQFLMGLTQLGVLGFLLVLAIPALTAGVMQAMAVAERGLRPPLSALFAAFYAPDRLLRLFLLSAVLIASATLIAGMILSGSVEMMNQDLLTRLEQGDLEALSEIDPVLIQRLAMAVLAGLAVSGSIAYFSIPLIWFRGQPVGAAILNGLVGMMKNWAPFLVLGGLLALMAVPVMLISLALLASSAGTGGSATALTLIMLLVMVAYQLLMFGAQYLSFKEIFGTGLEDSTPVHEEDQLVA